MLAFSAVGGLFFAVLGTAWGIVVKSDMIMFDGLYSLISLFLSILALYISNYINKADFEKFPFGKGALEPIMVAIQSLVLIAMCSISLINGIKEFVAGGNNVDTGLALMYSLISTVGCAFSYYILNKNGKKVSSEMVNAESNQWLMDTILSAAVLIGFVAVSIMSKAGYAHLTRYVDPVMVIISSVFFIKVPIKTLIKCFGEIVNKNADKNINDEIYTIVKDIEEEYNFEDSITRVSKVGRELRIEIDFVFNDNSRLKELEEMDKVREEVYMGMKDIKLNKWLNVNFTADRKWAV
ncbi:MAG: cation transporter [Clostridium sp.]|nr:cation transporter [Clostridium sp.]